VGDLAVTLLNPDLVRLGLLLTFLALVGLWAHAGRRRRLAEFLGGRRAVDRLSPSDLFRLRIERILLLGVGGVAAALAAGEPRVTASLVDSEPLGPPPKDVVIAIDVSASMQASDVPPTRLARAVQVAEGLMDELGEEHRVGLLLFAGTGYPLAPPTHDHEALRFILSGIVPTIASAQDPGSLISVGLREGMVLLGHVPAEGGEAAEDIGGASQPSATDSATAQPEGDSVAGGPAAGSPTGVGTDRGPVERIGEDILVIIGDGEAGEPEEVVAAATAAAEEAGIAVHTIGVGSSSGSGMMMPEGRYQLGGAIVDESGVRAVSHLETARLREIAASGGGTYVDGNDVSGLAELGSSLRDPGPGPDLDAPEALPFWVRHDVVLALGAVALSFVFLESLLDALSLGLPSRRKRNWASRGPGVAARRWPPRGVEEVG
jgi:Ca-activated chloride channel family protein